MDFPHQSDDDFINLASDDEVEVEVEQEMVEFEAASDEEELPEAS